jgi:hypothetical protein
MFLQIGRQRADWFCDCKYWRANQFIARPDQSSSPKIVIAIVAEPSNTTDVCKLASPFQDMVNPQVNLFQ